ncbi:MAG: hypothetical protein HC848_00020 [Limnobacter sp.]|nr:hypothetical protein [Limnobacter sp.]
MANHNAGMRSAYSLEIHSWDWLLSLNTDHRIYQNKSVIDIIKDVFVRNNRAEKPISISARWRAATRPWNTACSLVKAI